MNNVPLHKLIRVHYGKALKAEDRKESGTYSVYGSSGKIGQHVDHLFEFPSLVIGRKGSVGSVTYAPNGGWVIDTAFYVEIIDAAKADLRYLYYALRNAKLDQHTITTSIPGLSRDDIYRTNIPLPPLPEQRRIATILDKVASLREKRRQVIAKLDDLLKSVFIDMFGDPVTNPKGWSLVRIASLVKSFQGGKSIQSESDENADYRFRVLKVSAVTHLIYKPEESKPLPSSYIPPSEHLVCKGDLLFSRANTSELVGAVAYVWETPDDILLSDKLWRFVWTNPREIEPLFIWALFCNPSFRYELGKRATGTSGSMKNISQEKVLAMQIPFPDFHLQRRFSKIVQNLKTIQDLYTRSYNSFENLFTSLQQRAFSGELFADKPLVAPSSAEVVQHV